jgi:hypothetical protein
VLILYFNKTLKIKECKRDEAQTIPCHFHSNKKKKQFWSDKGAGSVSFNETHHKKKNNKNKHYQ